MEHSKIASKTTYHEVFRELNKQKYIKYIPSKSFMNGSRIHMVNFCPSGVHLVVSTNKHNKLIKHINKKQEENFDYLQVNPKKDYCTPQKKKKVATKKKIMMKNIQSYIILRTAWSTILALKLLLIAQTNKFIALTTQV